MSSLLPGSNKGPQSQGSQQPATGAATVLLGPFRLEPVLIHRDECHGRLYSSYEQLLTLLGHANTTRLHFDEQIPASWAFTDQYGRTAFVWAYRASVSELPGFTCWNVSGDKELLSALFANQIFWW